MRPALLAGDGGCVRIHSAQIEFGANLTPIPFGAACRRQPNTSSPRWLLRSPDSAKTKDSVKTALSESERKHAPKLGIVAESLMENEAWAFLRSYRNTSSQGNSAKRRWSSSRREVPIRY